MKTLKFVDQKPSCPTSLQITADVWTTWVWAVQVTGAHWCSPGVKPTQLHTQWLAEWAAVDPWTQRADDELYADFQLHPELVASPPCCSKRNVQFGTLSLQCISCILPKFCQRVRWKLLQKGRQKSHSRSKSQSLVTCMCVLSWSVMSDSLQPLDCSLPGSSGHWNFQVRILEWVAFPTPDLPDHRSNPCLLHLLHWQLESLPLCHLGSSLVTCNRGLSEKPLMEAHRHHRACRWWPMGILMHKEKQRGRTRYLTKPTVQRCHSSAGTSPF